MSFSEDWEYALSHANGDYITVLGDDDAMISGLSLAAELFQHHSIDAGLEKVTISLARSHNDRQTKYFKWSVNKFHAFC